MAPDEPNDKRVTPAVTKTPRQAEPSLSQGRASPESVSAHIGNAPLQGNQHDAPPTPSSSSLALGATSPIEPAKNTTTKRTFGNYLKRIRSAVSIASLRNAGNKARKTAHDGSANERAGTRAPSATSSWTDSRTATPVEVVRRASPSQAQESTRVTTGAPDFRLEAGIGTYNDTGPAFEGGTGYTPRARTPEEWLKARWSNLATYTMPARAFEAPSQPNYTTSVPKASSCPASRTTSPPAYATTEPRTLSNSPSPLSLTPRHLNTKEVTADITSLASSTPSLVPAKHAEHKTKGRVHWHCHRCTFVIGSNDICIACGHSRCKRCIMKRGSHKHAFQGDHQLAKSSQGRAFRERSPELKTRIEVASVSEEVVDEKTGLPRSNTEAPVVLQPPLKRRSISPTIADIPRILRRWTSARHNDNVEANTGQRVCHRCGASFPAASRHCDKCYHFLCRRCPAKMSDTGHATRRAEMDKKSDTKPPRKE